MNNAFGIVHFLFVHHFNTFKTKVANAGFRCMEPFNIKISIAGAPVTLTILPTSTYYKVIYFGGILGAITFKDKQWMLVDPANVAPGDLPLYHKKPDEVSVEVVLDDHNIKLIGVEIENRTPI